MRNAALVLGVLGAVVLTVRIATGWPTLPGPSVREALGLSESPEKPETCTPKPREVRRPPRPVPAEGRWRREGTRHELQDEMTAAAAADRIYLGTGIRIDDEFRSMSPFFSFDPASESWTRIPDAPVRLDHAATVARKEDVYLFGGFSDGKPNGRLWRYSPRTRRWQELARMRHPRGALSGALVGDRIHAVGGAPMGPLGGRAFATLEIYDPNTNRWSYGPDMPTPRHHLAAVALEGKLYAIGGRGTRLGREDLSLDAVERFDPLTERWESMAPLPQGAGGIKAATARGEIVVPGGGDDRERWVTSASWAFDPRKNRWRRLPDLQVPRHGHVVAAVDDRVFVLAGAPCVGYGRTTVIESLELP